MKKTSKGLEFFSIAMWQYLCNGQITMAWRTWLICGAWLRRDGPGLEDLEQKVLISLCVWTMKKTKKIDCLNLEGKLKSLVVHLLKQGQGEGESLVV